MKYKNHRNAKSKNSDMGYVGISSFNSTKTVVSTIIYITIKQKIKRKIDIQILTAAIKTKIWREFQLECVEKNSI